MTKEYDPDLSTPALLDRFRKGDRDAAAQLVTVFYDELRRIAAAHMKGEGLGHTLQPTALVNELYFKVLQQKPLPDRTSEQDTRLRSQADFFKLARYLMAQILIEHARSKSALKRRHQKVELKEGWIVQAGAAGRESEILRVLDDLEIQDPELRRLIDLRFFCGHSIAETAKLLGRGQTKVKADWRLAKLWLQRELGGLGEEFGPDEG